MAGGIITTPGSDTLSGTNTVPWFVPEIWSDNIVMAAKFATVVADRVNQDESAEMKVGDVLHVPRLSNLGERGIPNDPTTDLTFEAPEESAQNLTVDQQRYAAITVGSITEVQAKQNVLEKYSAQMGYALARAKDAFITGLGSGGPGFQNLSTAYGSVGVELTPDNYLSAWQVMQEAGIVESNDPGEEFSIILSPAAYAAALKVDTFANRQYNTAGDAIQRASVGDIYGFRVYMSNLLRVPSAGQHNCAAFHRDCFYLVTQAGVKTESDRLVQRLADVVAAWTVYGAVEVNYPPEAAPGSTTYTAVDNRGVGLNTV